MRLQLLLHQLAGLRVERGERLVHQQHFRVHDQRAREVHALLHAAGEFVRIVMLETREADEFDEIARARSLASRVATPMHSSP